MQELERAIHKLHYRTFDKVWPHIKEEFGDTPQTRQLVHDILDSFVKDVPKHKLKQKKYYNKIFSDHPHAWMMDLLDNKGQTDDYNNKAEKEDKEMRKRYPVYWFVFININTRYAAAYELNYKSKACVQEVLERFITEHKCNSLTSDKESAFVSESVRDFLKAHNISQYIVLDDNHTSLAIMDSFIRHLRDRNVTNEKSKYQSHHSKYRNFSVDRMEQLLDSYNKTPHSATGIKPEVMENDVKLERQWIAYNLIARSKRGDHTIPNGHFVRIILSKEAFKKHRYRVSHECYQITGRDGKNYLVSAADSTTKILPRHKLIDLGPAKPAKYKLADTIPNAQPPVRNIIDRDRQNYIVNYGDDIGAGEVRSIELRRHHPQLESTVERDFRNRAN